MISESLPPSCSIIEWLVRYVLRWTEAFTDDIFQRFSGSKATFKEQPFWKRPELSHSECFDLIYTTLQYYSRWINESQLIKNDAEGDHEQHEGVVKSALTASNKSQIFIRFATHPECIRYFGAEKYQTLCQAFDEHWLMGISLEDINRLYKLATETRTNFVYLINYHTFLLPFNMNTSKRMHTKQAFPSAL